MCFPVLIEMKRSISDAESSDAEIDFCEMLFKRIRLEPIQQEAPANQMGREEYNPADGELSMYWLNVHGQWLETQFEFSARMGYWWSWAPRVFWSEGAGWGAW